MKRRSVAFLLSLILSAVSITTASASDFLEDSEMYALQEEYADTEEMTLTEENPEEELTAEEVTETEEGIVVELPFGEELPQDEVNDFFEEVNMSELLETEKEELPNEENVEIQEEAGDFEEEAIPIMAELSAGWEEREVNGTVKYMHMKGSYDEAGLPEYYTSRDGIVTIQDKQYYFDENGYMLTGRVEYKGKYRFFMSADRATLNPGAVGTPNPSNSDLGQQKKGYWYWDGKAFQYYNSTGVFNSVAVLKEAKLKKGTYAGYFKIGGDYFILKDNGVPCVGDCEVEEGTRPGKYYAYRSKNEKGYPGALAIATWVKVTNSNGIRWRYYDKTGRTTLVVKAAKLDENIDPQVKGKLYLLTAGGYIYKKAAMRKAADGYTYICNKKGEVQTGRLVKSGGSRYYVDSKGRRVSWTNSWHWIDGRPYYFGVTAGKVSEKKGWVKVTDNTSTKWYYFTSNGNSAAPGWRNSYYFDSKCALVTGLKTIDEKTYFFKPSEGDNHNGSVVKNKLIEYKGNKYYAGADGVIYKEKWATISGSDYYFQADGTMAKSCYVQHGSGYGYVDSTGKFTTGWQVVDANANKIRYINTQAAGYVKNDYRVINGVRYYFDADGYRVSDLTSYYPSDWKNDPVLVNVHNGSYAPYYLECDKSNGVITIYANSTKTLPIRTVRTSVGNPTSLTPSGTYTLTRSSRWQPLMGPSWGQYGTHVVQGIFIHSVACTYANSYNLPGYAYDMLGSPASHGCMRVCVADAKWIYENCSGARITIFYGTYQSQECYKGPLGRKPLVPRRGAGNFDPTDPAV